MTRYDRTKCDIAREINIAIVSCTSFWLYDYIPAGRNATWMLSQFRCYREKYNGAIVVPRGQKKDEKEEEYESTGGNYTHAH